MSFRGPAQLHDADWMLGIVAQFDPVFGVLPTSALNPITEFIRNNPVGITQEYSPMPVEMVLQALVEFRPK